MGLVNTLLVFTVYSMNFVLLVGALFAIYVCLSDQRQKELSENLAIDFEFFALFPKVLLTVSIIVAIVSFIGCFGIAIDNDYMLIAYVIILGLLMISKIFLFIFLSHALNNSQSASGGDDLRKQILNSIKNNPSLPIFSSIQRKYGCCGVDGPEDWIKITESKKVPGSCCKKSDDEVCETSQYFGKKGCDKFILDNIGKVIWTLKDMVIHVFFIEIMLVTFCIMILMDIGQSDEDDTSEDNVFVGRIKNVPTAEEGEVPFDESIDTHDMQYKVEEDVENPVFQDEDIVELHDDEPLKETHEDETQEEEVDEDDKHMGEKQEEEAHEEEDQEEEVHDEEIHEEEKPVKEKRKKKKQRGRH